MGIILKRLEELSNREEFVIHVEGYLLPDYYRSQIFEYLRKEIHLGKEMIKCFTTKQVVNSAFFLEPKMLVFPVQENSEHQRIKTLEIIKFHESKINEKRKNLGVLLSTLDVSDRFYLQPSHQEQFVFMYRIDEKNVWAFSDRGEGKVLKTDTIVFL